MAASEEHDSPAEGLESAAVEEEEPKTFKDLVSLGDADFLHCCGARLRQDSVPVGAGQCLAEGSPGCWPDALSRSLGLGGGTAALRGRLASLSSFLRCCVLSVLELVLVPAACLWARV